MSLEIWTVVAALASAVGTLIAGVGLWYTHKGIAQGAHATELQVIESVFKDIRELEREYLSHFDEWSTNQKTAWGSAFFNTLEYLCFIMNHRGVDFLSSFWPAGALTSWMRLLDDLMSEGILRNDPSLFPEFRKRCAGSESELNTVKGHIVGGW